MKEQLTDYTRAYLFDGLTLTQMNTDLNEYVQFLPLVNFQTSQYDLLFVEQYSFWKLYSLSKGVPFLSLARTPPKEFDDFINEWVSTHSEEKEDINS